MTQQPLRQNSMSFRYAGTGHEFKIYFEDAVDLETQVALLRDRQEGIALKINEIRAKSSKELL